ncbi:hypothetical protein [Limnohabitans sp.]|jgi:hypothetical protein|uniref:hypothetical protein n=1 Tax=Limnohabitans sp. TaxID=1907725 RepID=UPI0037C0F26B
MSATTMTPSPVVPPTRGPNCWQCQFFGVSHMPAAPYACRAMGFSSKIMPSLEVLRTDGRFCRSFAAKTTVSA